MGVNDYIDFSTLKPTKNIPEVEISCKYCINAEVREEFPKDKRYCRKWNHICWTSQTCKCAKENKEE